jgi:hypothetical protein
LPLLLFFCVPVGRRRIRIVEESGVLRERVERSLLAKFSLFLMIF